MDDVFSLYVAHDEDEQINIAKANNSTMHHLKEAFSHAKKEIHVIIRSYSLGKKVDELLSSVSSNRNTETVLGND